MTLESMTEEQLEQLLSEKRRKKEQALAREKKRYESAKDRTIDQLHDAARELHLSMARFKNLVTVQMDKQAEDTSRYGSIKSTSKGGFTITHSDQERRITRRRDTMPSWDERGTKGIELVREFLHDFVRKRDADLFDILLDFIERNEKGELEYAKVMNLFKHESKFRDPRWKEGLRLVKESYSVMLRGFGYEFSVKNKQGRWTRLELNFSAI